MKPFYKNNYQEQQHILQLAEAIAKLENATEVQRFLEDLCTPTELQAMADRWRVVDFIQQGKPYRQIYEETGVSMTTIGRVARCLRFGSGGYHLVQTRIQNPQKEITP